MLRRSYITKVQVDRLRADLSDTDWMIIEDIAKLNVVTGQQLRRRYFHATDTGKRMARLHLQRLVDHRVLARLGRRIGGERAGSDGFVYALDIAGQRLVYGDRRARQPWTPGSQYLRHALEVSELFVGLKELEEITGSITLERVEAEPRCWRHYSGPGGARVVLKPDAYIVTASGDYIDSWFIEVDRDTEPLSRIIEKCAGYWRYWQSGREQETLGVFPQVVYIVPTDKRLGQLLDAFEEIPADRRHLFRVIQANQAAKALVSGELLESTGEEVEDGDDR